MEKLLKQRVEILAQEVDKMKSGGAGEGYTKAEADAKFLSKDDASTALAGKQDSLDPTQLAAVNSGIDSTKAAQIETNKTNILYSLQSGVKNLFDFDAWKVVEITRGTKTISGNAITITATSADAYTDYVASYPETVKIYVQTGDVIVLSWDYTANNNQTDDKSYIFGFGRNPLTPVSNTNTYSQTGYLEYVVPATVRYIEIRFGVTTSGNSATYSNIMICHRAAWDQEPNVYRPFALPNYDLTRLESEDRAALVECVDDGAKNLFDLQSVTSSQYDTNNATLVFNSDQTNFTVTATSNFGYARILATGLIPNAKYTLSFTVSNRNVDVDGTAILVRNAALSTTLATKDITANGRIDIEFTVPNNDTSVYMAFYVSMESASTTNTYTVSDVMVCTKADWIVSKAYQPYRPSYQELYEMVLALQTTRTATTRKTTKTKTNEE